MFCKNIRIAFLRDYFQLWINTSLVLRSLRTAEPKFNYKARWSPPDIYEK